MGFLEGLLQGLQPAPQNIANVVMGGWKRQDEIDQRARAQALKDAKEKRDAARAALQERINRAYQVPAGQRAYLESPDDERVFGEYGLYDSWRGALDQEEPPGEVGSYTDPGDKSTVFYREGPGGVEIIESIPANLPQDTQETDEYGRVYSITHKRGGYDSDGFWSEEGITKERKFVGLTDPDYESTVVRGGTTVKITFNEETGAREETVVLPAGQKIKLPTLTAKAHNNFNFMLEFQILAQGAISMLDSKALNETEEERRRASRADVIGQRIGSTIDKQWKRAISYPGGVPFYAFWGEEEPDEYQFFKALHTNLLDAFGRARTGMRIAVEEYDTFHAIIGDLDNNSPRTIINKLKQLIHMSKTQQRIMLSNAGYTDAQQELRLAKTRTLYEKWKGDLELGVTGNVYNIVQGKATTGDKIKNRPQRNNNPVNLKGYDPNQEVDKDGFRIFKTPKEGFDAARADILLKLTGKSIHAPPGGFETFADIGAIWTDNPDLWIAGVDSIMEQDYDISNVSTMAPLDLVPHVNDLVMAIARQEGYFANNAPSANAPPQKLREPEGEKPEHSWVAGYVGNEDLINEEAVEALREAKNAGSKLARKVLEDWVKYQRSLQQTSTAVSHSSDVTHDPVPSVGDTIRNIGQLQGNTQ